MTALCIACGVEEPAPVLCITCTDRARRHLDTIGRLRRELDPMPSRGRGGRAPGKPGSRPPANLTVLSITDVRSRVRIDPITCEHDPDDVANVDADLLTEARLLSGAMHLKHPLRDVFDVIRILHLHFEWLVRCERADKVCAVLETCSRGLAAVLRQGEPSVGRCTAEHPSRPACGGPLRLAWEGPLPLDPDAQVAPTHVSCAWCGDVWGMADLVNIGRVTPLVLWDTPPKIAILLGMSERTLQHWIKRGRITRNSHGMVSHAEVWKVIQQRLDTPDSAGA